MLKIIQYCLVLLIGFAAACKSSPANKQQVLAIREMGNLATTEYTVTKLVKANDNQTWYKLGDRKILISCQATIKAGVDLSQLNKDNIETDGSKITIYLPKPAVMSINMAPEHIKVEHQEIGILRTDFNSAERDDLLKQAETQINNSIAELGILAKTRENTSLFLEQFLRKLGFTDITIRYDQKIIPSKPLS